MKSKPSGIVKDQPALVDASYTPGFPIQNAALDWMMLARDILPKATPLRPEERASINEFFWSHFR